MIMGLIPVIFTLFVVILCRSITQINGQNGLESEFEYVLLNNKNPCRRECQPNMPPMICKFKFQIEWYLTMSKACFDCPYNITDCYRPDCIPGDGVRRAVVTVNRQIPGTHVEVCKGDLVIVDVENELTDEGTTIHWHGQHQRGTPYMDGVPTITQCAIQSKQSFRYKFYANEPGTHFWHSHMGFQRGDGAFGGFTVRVPRTEDPHTELYDLDLSEHQIVFLDWDHIVGVQRFQAHHHSDGDNKPPGLLVNGYGKFQLFPGNENETDLYTPLAKFTVTQGFRYRFRMVNAGYLNCPIEVNIDNHDLLVISSDGKDIEPIQVSSVVTYAGERFDFILYANETIDNYWIRFQGLMDCDKRFTSTFQTAILHYDGASDEEPLEEVNYETAHKEGLQLNALNTPENDTNSILMSHVRSIEENDISLKETPDMQLFLSYDFNPKDNSNYHRKDLYGFKQVAPGELRVYTPQINYITMRLPKFPLLPERKHIKPDMFCNETTMTDCENRFCECTYVYQIPYNAVVELIFIDKGVTYDANHPLHLHGHYFRVIAMDKLGKNTTEAKVKELDRLGLIKRNLDHAPFKDTVTIPDGGYTIVRFHANNPGYWFFHCHIEWHAEVGMAVIFKVGEHSQLPPVPKNFPKCYDFHQSSDEKIIDEPVNQPIDENAILLNIINEAETVLHLTSKDMQDKKTNSWWIFYNSSNYLIPANLLIVGLLILSKFII